MAGQWRIMITTAVFVLQFFQMWLLLTHFQNFERDTGSNSSFSSSSVVEESMRLFSAYILPAKWMEHKITPKPSPFPPLEDLVDKRNAKVVGNVDWLLDFDLIGFPRCGQTVLLTYLSFTSKALVLRSERCVSTEFDGKGPHDIISSKATQQQDNLVEALYYARVNDNQVIRGVHCSKELEETISRSHQQRSQTTPTSPSQPSTALAIHFPKTKLVVGVRHPIVWFEAVYNHRQSWGANLPNAVELIGNCSTSWTTTTASSASLNTNEENGSPSQGPSSWEHAGLCTDRARFHYHLAALGHTSPLSNPTESSLLFDHAFLSHADGSFYKTNFASLEDWSNYDLFFYEYHQLNAFQLASHKFLNHAPLHGGGDISEDAPAHPVASKNVDTFFRDLGKFLGLQVSVPKGIHQRVGFVHTYDNGPYYSRFNICHQEYKGLREVLLTHAQQAQEWFINHFLESPKVTVSNKAYLVELLQRWEEDPCEILGMGEDEWTSTTMEPTGDAGGGDYENEKEQSSFSLDAALPKRYEDDDDDNDDDYGERKQILDDDDDDRSGANDDDDDKNDDDDEFENDNDDDDGAVA